MAQNFDRIVTSVQIWYFLHAVALIVTFCWTSVTWISFSLAYDVQHSYDAHGCVLKLCFPWTILYADSDESTWCIQTMIRESSVWSSSCSHSDIGKFGSVEHKPLKKRFLKVRIALSVELILCSSDGINWVDWCVDKKLFDGGEFPKMQNVAFAASCQACCRWIERYWHN